MSAPATPELSARAVIARVARVYMAPRWKGWLTALVAAIVVAVLSAKLIQILEPATNDLMVNHKPGALLVLPLTIAIYAIGRAVAQVVQATLVNRIGNGVVGDVQVQLFGRLVRADLARLRSQHSGAYVSSVLYDAGLIREAATAGVINYTQHLLTVIGAITVMVSNDKALSIVLVAVLPLSTWIMRRFSKRTTKAAKGAMIETSALSTAIMESLDGVRVVKIENREAYEEGRIAEVVQRRQTHLVKGANARARAAPATELMMTVVTAAVIAYAGWRSENGAMTVGAFVAFIAALGLASQSLRQLANLQTVMAEGMSAARRLFAVLDVQPEVREAPGAAALPRGDGMIRLEEVAFAYADGATALSGVSLEARRGETIALVGPSGGGKTTLLNLIPRFYDPSAGRVTIDGHDLHDVTIASLRDQIALVTQEPFLFDDTIAANIGYPRPGATREAIEQSARAAAAHEFILDLPNGYETSVGEAGARLSGGQRQRIAIARAFLKDAPILLLDEATSALDTESEAQVQAALKRLMAGRTTILIAHRLSTVRGADRIYVVDKGRIVETGDHASLIKRRGLYARLARSQHLEATGLKQLIRAPAAQAALGWLLGGYMQLLLSTVRWRHENLACVEPQLASDQGAVALFWHGRVSMCLAVVPQWGRRKRPAALVSPSADGEFIARALAHAGFPSIRASSVKPGDLEKARAVAVAVREAVAWAAGGGVLIATPDGPRGPNEVLAPGTLQIARRAGVPVYLMGIAAAPAIRFKSWDKAVLALPFARGAVVWDGPLQVPAGADEAALAKAWGERLSAATRQAEAMVRPHADCET